MEMSFLLLFGENFFIKKKNNNISLMDAEMWKSHCDKWLSKRGKEVVDLEHKKPPFADFAEEQVNC